MAEKKKRGRPPKMTDACLDKLNYAFSIGCTDKEACLYADISEDCLYLYQRKHPEYLKRKRLLKEKPVLKAREASDKLLSDGDAVHVRWFLEHKKSEEFNTRSEVAVQTDGLTLKDRSDALTDFLRQFLDD